MKNKELLMPIPYFQIPNGYNGLDEVNSCSLTTITKNVKKWAKDHFGDSFKFRPLQLQCIINIIDDKLNNHIYHHVIQAPTGSGKSLINIITAGVLWEYYKMTSYILCTDLYLYKQYEDVIDKYNLMDFAYLKGQTGNYSCAKDGRDLRCAECKLKRWKGKLPQWCLENCQYYIERVNAVNSPITLLTYQNFHLQMNVPATKVNTHKQPIGFAIRDLIFGDECHNIPSIIQEKCQPYVSNDIRDVMIAIQSKYCNLMSNETTNGIIRSNGGRMPEKIFENVNDFKDAFDTMYNEMKKTSDSYHDTINVLNYERKIVKPVIKVASVVCTYFRLKIEKLGKQLTNDEYEIFSKISHLQNYHCYLDDFSKSIQATGFVYTIKQINDDIITFSCIREDGMIAQLLNRWSYCGTIYLSATCGDIETFTNNMGYRCAEKIFYANDLYGSFDMNIDAPYRFADPKFYNINSTFDFTKSPIYICNEHKMSYNQKQQSIVSLAKVIEKLCNKKHKNDNGLIHTGSFENAKTLYELIPKNIQSRILMYENTEQKHECIAKIKSKTNYILIGPSLNEGIDLPGDLCRFVIVLKIPFLSLGDKYVTAKMKMFKTWYPDVAATNLIQGIGRGNRFENDYCTTYILDACFKSMFSKTKNRFDKYITDRFVYTNEQNLTLMG